MTPSPFQQTLYNRFTNICRNIFVDAGPGSGKSTTIKKGASFFNPEFDIGFFCFGKEIALHLQKELPKNATASTIHAYGRQCLAKYQRSKGRRLGNVDEWKYVNIAEQALESLPIEHKIKQKMRFELKNLTILALNTRTEYGQGATPAAIEEMALKYNISVTDTILYSLVSPCVKAGIDLFKLAGCYDFIDMTTLPVILDMEGDKFDVVLIDEGQDLNDAQLTLMFRAVKEGGFMVMVADRLQSIMGFAGAMPDAVDQFIKRANAETLPLSVCYRCPPNVVAMLNYVSPTLQAFHTEPGIIKAVTQQESMSMAQKGDFILCRLKAPLVKQCLMFISRGTSAIIKGQDIGKDLIRFAESASDRREPLDYQWEGFPNALRAEAERILMKMTKEKREISNDTMQDNVEALIALYDHYTDVHDIKEYCKKIADLFVDKTYNATIVLSTVHKSKGLEADRIFILDGDIKRNFWPLTRKGALDWELEQERNLIYVGLSRTKGELYFINDKVNHEIRLNYFQKGVWASLGQGAGNNTRKQTKENKIEKPKEAIVIDTKVIVKKKEDRLAKWKEKRAQQQEEDLPLLKPLPQHKQSSMNDDDEPIKTLRKINRI